MGLFRARVLVGFVAVGLLLVGCAQKEGGTPRAAGATDGSSTSGASTSATTGSPSPDPGGRKAPAVAHPKNLRGMDPCALLSPAQQAELTFTRPGEKNTSLFGEEQCAWQNGNLRVLISPDTRRRGLDEVYRRRGNFGNFQPSEVDGYPAVRLEAVTQSCALAVGVAADQQFHVNFGRITGRDPRYRDPCGFAESVARMVLANLPAGS
ncbi:Protein of unknown function (DUF3558) [Streptoalloteichus tenebrarius]|uniref:DUF3558 domain-containing protein n=1 Tax=Streptoalloteichus tenebrarius (strain ATCC 17920 / DSM 40477 / JCM 4838 / CBS 697.72 / NBRC 16177 / NCIMB 11028 / NRRL B-12390 / A12253. 1 / ISP 5477) TaxID=1933 RepID=A0ABT1I0W5_STRSD|nr:DUF3558 domain-containing protein [Streptoalloteichus tenebrarius]MCP2261376.1 Protein of unknown function (DUF3558) [Streptoalloteichus tenebrarius]BFF00918.1 hypothetical protein GCM10020241_25930 [Streptoalloteichus tenebrarius]